MKNAIGELRKRKGIVNRNVKPSGIPIHESKIVVSGFVNKRVEIRRVVNIPWYFLEKKTNNE